MSIPSDPTSSSNSYINPSSSNQIQGSGPSSSATDPATMAITLMELDDLLYNITQIAGNDSGSGPQGTK